MTVLHDFTVTTLWTVIERYSPTTTPASLAKDIEAALGAA